MDARHATRYFIRRRDNDPKKGDDRPKRRHGYKRYGKLMIVVCCLSHAVLAAVASEGPAPDVHQLDGVLPEAFEKP